MSDIKELIFSTFERDKMIAFLDQFDQIIFNTNSDVKSFINNSVDEAKREFIMSRLNRAEGGTEYLFSLSKTLRQELEGLPVITLTVPMEVDQQFASHITELTRSITGTQVLVDIKKDLSLIGGAIVEGVGRVCEYSFRRYFELQKEAKEVENGL
jgi:hypothetical protein